jgi:hypothetical protein
VEFLRNRGDLCFDVVQLLGNELMELPKVIHKRVTRAKRTNA